MLLKKSEIDLEKWYIELDLLLQTQYSLIQQM